MKHLLRQIVFCFAVLSLPCGSFAYDYDRALNNLSHEFVICAAYYSILKGGAETARGQKTDVIVSGAEAAYNRLIDLAVMISNQDVVLARFKLEMEDMSKKMKFDYSNISILAAEYSSTCKSITENHFLRFKYWLDKK